MYHDIDFDLIKVLVALDVPSAKAEEAAKWGYFLHPFQGAGREPVLLVTDSFYGIKQTTLHTIQAFAEYLKGAKIQRVPTTTAIYENVRNLHEIQEILRSERHKRYYESGSMTFRGQRKDHRKVRPVPNPAVADADGSERTIFPGYWRGYAEQPINKRPIYNLSSIFSTMAADHLIYKGIPNWQTLGERNSEKYGFHTIGDLEDFPDADSVEYHARWKKHKILGHYNSELPLLEQHYGIETIGLDVTFDFATAVFFATNKFQKKGSMHTYLPVPDGAHTGVLYAFVFTSPSVRSTEWQIKNIDVFSHIPPIRPIRQQCALPAFHSREINAAVRDLDSIFLLHPDFSLKGIPDAKNLFPLDEDHFYLALLEEKKRLPKFFGDIVEYDFD